MKGNRSSIEMVPLDDRATVSASAVDGTLAFLGKPFPQIIKSEGSSAIQRFVEFFSVNLRSPNTRQAYAHAVDRFLDWCVARGLGLTDISPLIVAEYTENHPGSESTVKQHLAAIRRFFDWMATGGLISGNPAAPVRGPKHIVRRGKTPVLPANEAKMLLESIDCSHVVGLRDRAVISVMIYSFARVSAVVGLRREDYYRDQGRVWFRLREKGGKVHELPVHHIAERMVDAYLDEAKMDVQTAMPLFRSVRGRTRTLTNRPMHRMDVLRMIKRRARDAGISTPICCHTFRATGITAYLENGGTIERAQSIAAHESPRTTKLYDRTNDVVTIEEIERIRL